MRSSPILTAQWRNLVMLNYVVDPELLRPFVPCGTEIDFWNDQTFVSVVGFQFQQARWFGWRLPWQGSIDEINLRFYVRRKSGREWRRGVVFLKEIAPCLAISLVARWVYNEQYITLATRSVIESPVGTIDGPGSVSYLWKWDGRWNEVAATIRGRPCLPESSSEAEYIAEHYWAYTAQRDGSTLEHHVEHPPWLVWPAETCRFSGDIAKLYGLDFARVLNQTPTSAFVADGSAVSVHRAGRLTAKSVRNSNLRNSPCPSL